MDSDERMELRPAREEDLPRVVRLFSGAVRRMRENGIEQWDEIYPDADILSSDIQKREMYLLETDGNISAAVVLNEDQPPEYTAVPWKFDANPVAVVHRLCVAAESQGKRLGVGTLLLSEELLKKRGYRCIRLDAFPRNPAAMRLYPSCGYRFAGRVTFRKGLFNVYEKLLTLPEKRQDP